MLPALSLVRNLAALSSRACPNPAVAQRNANAIRHRLLTHTCLRSARPYHTSQKLWQNAKPPGDMASEGEVVKSSTLGAKAEVNVPARKSSPGEASEASEPASKGSVEQNKDAIVSTESTNVTKAPKEEETAPADSKPLVTVTPPVSSVLSRRGRKNRSGFKSGRSSSSKNSGSFNDVDGYPPDEVEALGHLRAHIYSLLSSFCTSPRSVNLANFPSINPLEQEQVDHAINTLLDEQISRKLELEAFAHLTSTPMSSLMAKGRTAMFNQIGFTLKAPSDHEAYVTHTIQRLAEKYNSKVIDFDFPLLRQSESWFTDSMLQSGNSEESTSNIAHLFQEIVRDDDDFTLFSEVLFEVIEKQSSASLAPQKVRNSSESSTLAQANPLEAFKQRTTPSFVVVLRGMNKLRSFPYHQFKELLRACRAHVLFLELEFTAPTPISSSPQIGIISPVSPSFMIAPGSLGDEEEGDGMLPSSLRSVLERLSMPAATTKTPATQYFLHIDPINMTNRAILEAERRKAEDSKTGAGSDSGGAQFGSPRGPVRFAGILGRLPAEPSSTSPAPSVVPTSIASTASVISAAENAAVALATLQRRSNLQHNLKELAACIRASHVVLVPNVVAEQASEKTELATAEPTNVTSAGAQPSVAPTSASAAPSTSNEQQSTDASTNALATQKKSGLEPLRAINPIIHRLFPATPSATASAHPSIPIWNPQMRCLTEYWLNPDLSQPAPESFELTSLILGTQTLPLQNVGRIIRQAIKLQDMHQFQMSGTWNHFSPMAGMLVRVGLVEAALESSLLDGVSPFTDEQIEAIIEQEAKNEPIIRMPLEIRFLHEALNIELAITEKFKPLHKTPASTATKPSSNAQNAIDDAKLLPVAKRAYAYAVKHYPAPRILKEGEYDTRKSVEDQKAREATDEFFLQERLRGMKLNTNEKAMLQNYVSPSRLETTFDDIGSLEHAKEELLSLIVPMSLPVFHKENSLVNTPLGILLYGPPGTGKTMLAKALAKTANASFIHISASTIISKWLGDSEGHAAAVFSLARKISPCLIFIDEVDGLLHSRDSNEHETSRRVKNEFFSGWDGLLSNSNDPNMSVTVIAATNRPFDLDNAALRRLPHRVLVNLPDKKARVEIIQKTLKSVFLAPVGASADIKREQITEEDREKIIDELATLTDGYSGSDIKSVCTRAAQQHVRDFMKGRNANDLLKPRPNPIQDAEYNLSDELDAENAVEAAKHEYYELASQFARRPLTMKEFQIALSEISASVNQRSGTSVELKKWHETYGSKPPGQRHTGRPTPVGF